MSAYPYETTKQAGWPKSLLTSRTRTTSVPDLDLLTARSQATRPSFVAAGVFTTTSFPASSATHENIFNPPWRSGPASIRALPGTPTQPFLPDLTFYNPFPTNAQSGPAANPLIYYDPAQSG